MPKNNKYLLKMFKYQFSLNIDGEQLTLYYILFDNNLYIYGYGFNQNLTLVLDRKRFDLINLNIETNLPKIKEIIEQHQSYTFW